MAESQIRMALEKLSQTIAGQPEKAKAKHSPATATLMTGVKCRVRGPGGEQIETDMPAAMGGAASGPNPGWFFRASLASCCATVIAMRAARLGVNLTMLEVAVESDGDHRGILGLDDRISAGMSSLHTTVQRFG
jgi:organic hydroperoxide reductase OsmC/OhrA